MAPKLVVIENDRVGRGVSRLQSSCHFSRVEWITVLIRVAGDDQRRGIGYAVLDPMVG